MKKQSLTPKQEKFCLLYFESGNASEAYREAYDASKMKAETINRRAFDLVNNGKIKARLDELFAPAREKLAISSEKTLKRLMQGQEFDVRRLYHDDGRLKMPHELDEDTAKAIVGVKHDKDTGLIIEYKVIDVKGCADLIGKHLKLWTEKIEHGVDKDDPLMKTLMAADGKSRGLPKPAPMED